MKLSRITWEPKYSVQNEALDAEHRKLFDTTNRLLDVFESDGGDVLPVFRELVDFLSTHFHAEHMVMMNVNYPWFTAHSQEHLKFTTKMQSFLKSYKEDDTDLTFNMVVFLRDWVHDHTCGIDQAYGKYLQNVAKNTPKTGNGTKEQKS